MNRSEKETLIDWLNPALPFVLSHHIWDYSYSPTIWKPVHLKADLHKSGFQVFPDFKWSDFRSPLYLYIFRVANENTDSNILSLLWMERVNTFGESRTNRPRKIQLGLQMSRQSPRFGTRWVGSNQSTSQKWRSRRSCSQNFGQVDNYFAVDDKTGFQFLILASNLKRDIHANPCWDWWLTNFGE